MLRKAGSDCESFALSIKPLHPFHKSVDNNGLLLYRIMTVN